MRRIETQSLMLVEHNGRYYHRINCDVWLTSSFTLIEDETKINELKHQYIEMRKQEEADAANS